MLALGEPARPGSAPGCGRRRLRRGNEEPAAAEGRRHHVVAHGRIVASGCRQLTNDREVRHGPRGGETQCRRSLDRGSSARARRRTVPLHRRSRTRCTPPRRWSGSRTTDGASGIGAYDSDSYGDWDRARSRRFARSSPRLVGMDPDDHDGDRPRCSPRTARSPVPARGAVDDRHRLLGPRRATAGQPLHRGLGGDPASDVAPVLRLGPADVRRRGRLPRGDRRATSARGSRAVKVHAWGVPRARRGPASRRRERASRR